MTTRRELTATFFVVALLSISAPLVAQAPPKGSGSVVPTGAIRVIDGDTLDVIINGRRVAVGLIGLKAPEGNTPCGKQAIQAMGVLVHAGMQFDEDTNFTFDKKTRRMYYARSKKDGHSLIVDMVSAGYAQAESVADPVPDFPGAEDGQLKGAEQAAQNGKKGCLWGGGGQPGPKDDPLLLAAAGITRADLDPANSDTEPNAKANVTSKLSISSAQPRVSTPAGFSVSAVASGLTNPTAMTFLPDGRILIALKAGIVRVYKPGSGLLPTPFIDITASVNDFWDHGLIGIAADVNFATNHFVYLLHTYEDDPTSYSGPKTSRLVRVTASGDTAPLTSMTTILGTVVGPGCGGFPAGSDCLPSENSSHSIGNVKAAADGTLYVTVGDGASFNVVDPLALRSQDVDSLAGKMLHITTSGMGVSANPFWNGTASANRSKLWSYGHRNSFRFNQRPTTGTIYVGEVGWNTWEKIQLSPKGANQGWPCYEGGLQQPGYAPFAQCQALYSANTANPPLLTWSHTDSQGNTISAAAVGGAFYTGTSFPAQYQGAYFFADYGQSLIRYLTVDANDKLVGTPTDFAVSADGPVDVEMGPDGNLYYLAINTGELRTILYGASTIPPPGRGTTYLSDLTWTSVSNGWGPVEKDMSNGEQPAGDGNPITIGGVVHTKGLGAHAPSDIHYNIGGVCSSFNAVVGIDGEILPAYQSTSSVVFQVWADGAKLYDSGTVRFTTPPVNVSVAIDGKSDLELVITDAGDGNAADHADWADARVTCGSTAAQPTATIATPLSTLTYKVGDTITYSGSATDGNGGTVPASGLTWAVNIHHCPGGVCHIHPGVFTSTGASGSFVVPDHGDDSYFEIALTATNTAGQTDTKSVSISPKLVNFTLNSSPSGLQLVYGGTQITTPYTHATIIGSAHTITAPTAEGTCAFSGWSDNGAAQHNVTAGSTDLTFTATYTGCAPTTTKFASDVAWASATNGWGPVEKDMSNGEQAAGDGHTISIRGKTYAKGLGVNAPANIVYNLSTIGSCTSFTSDVGVDDETHGGGSVVFQLIADGTTVFDSGLLTGVSPVKTATVDITGKSQLTLIVTDGGDGPSADHADWAGAQFTCSAGGGDTTPPTVTSVSPAAGATNVAANSPVKATFSEAMNTATLTTSTFTLLAQGATTPVAATVAYDAPSFTVTLTPSTALQLGTQYTATVKSGANGVKDASNNALAADKTWTFTTSATAGSTKFLSDLTWTSMTNGWGPAEKDMSNGEQAAGDGRTISIRGKTYAKGLGVHALSNIVYNLAAAGSCTSFTSDVGVDDETSGKGSVDFQVVVDGVTVFDSGVVTGTSSVKTATANITGKSQLTLIVNDGGDGNANDHADWAGAQLTCSSGTDTTPPTVASVSPAASATGVPTSSAVRATFSEAMNPATISTTTFTLVLQGTTTPIGATVAYDGTSFTATLTPSAILQAGKVYTATIKGTSSGVKDASNNALAADKVWSFTTSSVATNTKFLSDLTWTSMTNGWGPAEKDMSNGEQAAGDGHPISIRGKTYAKGLGVHALSNIVYNLTTAGSCTSFNSDVGIDDEVNGAGSVIFQVLIDGVKAFDSGVVTGTSAVKTATVNVTGKSQLTLVVNDDGDGLTADHSDWAGAQLTCQ